RPTRGSLPVSLHDALPIFETGVVSEPSLARAVAEGKLFPCWFGAALKLEGVEEFLDLLTRLAPDAGDKGDFGAQVYKITRDDQGDRKSTRLNSSHVSISYA